MWGRESPACSVNVPVCVVKGMSETPSVDETPCMGGVVTSVPECVFPSTPCVQGAPRVKTARVCEPPCVSETPRVSAPACVGGMVCVSEARRVSERPCVRRTACVRSLCVREMSVGMCEHAAASPGVNGMVRCSLGVVTCRCAWVEWSLSARMRRRRRLRHLRDKAG